MRILISLAAVFALCFGLPASAQSGLGGILEDIFGGQGHPPTPSIPQAEIDNIPVAIFNEDGRDLGGHILIVTAHVSPPANVRIAKPQFLGETRILLSGLRDPLQIVVAAPANITRNIDAAQLSARVIDSEGRVVLESRDDDYYHGRDPAKLVLVAPAARSPKPSSKPSPNGAKDVTLRGSAVLPENSSPLPRGGKLRVILMEDDVSGLIVSESLINIDQKSSPYAFSFAHTDMLNSPNKSFIIRAEIIDWAGRVTHKNKTDQKYTGPNTNYILELTENTALAGSASETIKTKTSMSELQGKVIFDAYKGLPKGAKMIVTLRKGDAVDHILDQQTIAVGPYKGPESFSIPMSGVKVTAGDPAPFIDVRITDAKNMTLFAAAPIKVESQALAIRLRTDPRY